MYHVDTVKGVLNFFDVDLERPLPPLGGPPQVKYDRRRKNSIQGKHEVALFFDIET
jgi:hypothetical protein